MSATEYPMPVKTYELYVKVDREWKREGTIYARSHPDALRDAISHLKPEHYELPIRVEQVEGLGGMNEATAG